MKTITMHYTTITAEELKKMDWVKVRAETETGIIIEWEIIIQWNSIYILHNNNNADGGRPHNMRWYGFSWSICNSNPHLDIKRLETIDDSFVEWEEVYVSDESVEDAIKKWGKNIYLMKSKMWKHLVVYSKDTDAYNEWEDFVLCTYSYVAKIPKEETIEMTMEEVCKALGKRVKIID